MKNLFKGYFCEYQWVLRPHFLFLSANPAFTCPTNLENRRKQLNILTQVAFSLETVRLAASIRCNTPVPGVISRRDLHIFIIPSLQWGPDVLKAGGGVLHPSPPPHWRARSYGCKWIKPRHRISLAHHSPLYYFFSFFIALISLTFSC